MTFKAIKLKMYPNEEQKLLLPQHFGNVRFVWNRFVRYAEIAYHNHIPYMNYYTLCNLITKMKKKYPFLKLSSITSLQNVCDNFNKTYKMFFKHNGGKPNFHKRSNNQSYTLQNSYNTIHFVSNHYIKLPKFKTLFKVSKCHQPYGHIKRVTIEMKSTGKYYLILLVESKAITKLKTNHVVGFDFGLRNNIILSNGTKVAAFKVYTLERKLKIAQRKFSRRMKLAKKIVEQENAYNKKFELSDKDVIPWYERYSVVQARHQVARLNTKIKNKRFDFLQKLSTYLVSNYDVIVCEDLKVKNMMKNHKLAHAIAMQGWSTLKRMLQYKCDWYNKKLILINPKNTTQICANCNYCCSHKTGDFVKKGIEKWICLNCGCYRDRDYNAAQNILNSGLRTTTI